MKCFPFSELYILPDGDLIVEGDVITDPKLAVTMQRIADDPMSFYTGTLANDIIADLEEYGTNPLILT